MRVLMCLLVVAVLGGSGCSAFCPGPSDCLSNGAVVVRVVDAETKAPVADATVLASLDGANPVEAMPCRYAVGHTTDAGPSNCRAVAKPGRYTITVRATGYVEATIAVDSLEDSCGHVTSQEREVGLHKLGSSAQPLVNSSEKCGG